MRKAIGKRRDAGQAIVAAVVGVAFVLQFAFALLHLARNDHVLLGGSGAHVHAHGLFVHEDGGHRHDGGHPESNDPESDHEPHPVADHLHPLAAPATPPSLVHTDLALAPQAFTILLPDTAASVGVGEPQTCPRPPPPRDGAPPRAPPIVA